MPSKFPPAHLVPAILLASASLLLHAPAALAAPPELRVSGNQVVVKSTGSPVRLTGVNCPSLEWGPGEHLRTTDAHGGSITVATATWKANIIRLPVSLSRWLSGGVYLTTVDDVIAQASARNAYVILDLHEYARPTPQCVTFWSQAAARYRNNPAVLFGLLNEPHGTTWPVWRDGDASNPGMQDLLDTVRATGANNIVVAGGLDYAYDISGAINGYALTDTASGNGVIYDTHIYPWKSAFQAKVGNVAQVHPVIAGELGHPGVTTFIGLTFEAHGTWVPRTLDWVDTHNLHWTGWTMHPGADPCMILDWNYTPTSFWGAAALARLQAYSSATAVRVVGGKVIGTPGTRLNPSSGVITDVVSGAVAPFNGSTSTSPYFDAPVASGAWTGLDVVSPQRITQVKYMPRFNNGALMVGGVFQGSNVANFSSGVVTLFTVTTAPAATGEIWTTGNVSNTGSYRYVRYVGPNNSYCNVRGLKFLGYPAAAPNVNLVTNPSFDAQGATQTPSGWTEWKDAATSYTETAGGAHSGANHGTHSSTIPYEVTTHQLRTGLVNGTYTLRAWVKSSGGQSPAAIFARNHGSTMLTASIPASSSWIQVTLANINVTNGQCEFGVWSRVYTGGAWLYFDDIEFVRN